MGYRKSVKLAAALSIMHIVAVAMFRWYKTLIPSTYLDKSFRQTARN